MADGAVLNTQLASTGPALGSSLTPRASATLRPWALKQRLSFISARFGSVPSTSTSRTVPCGSRRCGAGRRRGCGSGMGRFCSNSRAGKRPRPDGESATKNWTFGNQVSRSLKNCGCRLASHQASGRSRRITPGCWSGSGSSRRVEASKTWRAMSKATITGRRNDARVACQRASNAPILPRLPPTSQPSQSLKSLLNLMRSARARPARYLDLWRNRFRNATGSVNCASESNKLAHRFSRWSGWMSKQSVPACARTWLP